MRIYRSLIPTALILVIASAAAYAVDNSTLPVFGGSTEVFANEDISGVKYPKNEMGWGPAGTFNKTDIASGKAMPVQLRSAAGLIPFGEPTDAKSTATDTTSVSLIALTKEISFQSQAMAALLGGTLTVNLPTGAATAANQSTINTSIGTTNTNLGPPGATVCSTDTGSCSQNSLLQRVASRISSLITALGTPMQSTGGTVGLVPSAASGAGISAVSSSALAANTVIKASAGNLYSFQVSADSTLSAAAWWIMIYDATSAPADGAVTPKKCYALPSGSTLASFGFQYPVAFSTGIVIGVSTTGCFTKTASTHAFISGDAQ